MTFVDADILLDVAQAHGKWLAWSSARLRERFAVGPLVINDVVYAEVSVGFVSAARLDEFLSLVGIHVERTSGPALILAARAHLDYRRQGGTRRGVLPDFFIGAHAALAGMPLLTRDARRYRTYFPSLSLILP